MALITCKSCGKEVSDRAKVCPACGATLIEEVVEEIQPNVCQECGFEIPADSESCPNCGCPIEVDDSGKIESETPQKVEVTAVNLPEIKQKTKKGIIIVAIVVVIAIIGTLIGVKVSNVVKAEKAALLAQEQADRYEHNLTLISVSMISGAAKAESSGNLIKSVWYNAIYKERDSSTDKYTRPNGYFVDDFNTALGNLFSDSSFSSTINEIEDNQDLVAGYMKDLKNPPEGFEEAYSAVKDCYDAYVSFTNLVTNPTGSLQTFSSNFNDADTTFLNKYNALKLYIE